MSAGSDEKEIVATWIKWKWKCCHLDDMKVRVMSPGWDGSWLISSDGTVQPNSCSFLSWFHVKLCWPMTIVSGGEAWHAMCFFLPKRKICTHPCGFYCRKPLQSPVISEHFEWDFGFDILFPLIQPALSKCTHDIGLEVLCSFLHLRFETVNAGKFQ